MADTSKIEWTDASWNPLAGCEYASEGCRGCYAARDAYGRLSSTAKYGGLAVKAEGELPRFTGEIRLWPKALNDPLHWREPKMVFVNSMSDLFHPKVPVEYISQVFDVMATASQHTFQVLTKRPQRMWKVTKLLAGYDNHVGHMGETMPLPNLWMGASIELDEWAWRAKHVRSTIAAVRFLSLEPLLGPLPSLQLDGIDWVIIGGESGSRARPMNLSWVRDIMSRCRDAGVPVFVKQLGAAWPDRHHRDLKGHDITTWPEDLQVREWPAAVASASS